MKRKDIPVVVAFVFISALSSAAVLNVAGMLPVLSTAIPDYSWDLTTTYAYAPAKLDESEMTASRIAQMDYFDGAYPLAETYPNGAGLSAQQMQEIADLVAVKYAIVRDPVTGALAGRDIVIDTEDALPAASQADPASFNADWCRDINTIIDYYASASAEQAAMIEQAYRDLVELYLDEGYVPGWTGELPRANGYEWRNYGYLTLRMVHTLPQTERDLFLLSLFYYSGAAGMFATDVPDTLWSNTDQYYCVFPTAFRALAKMTDNAFKWQLINLFRRQMDVGLVGTNGQDCLITVDGGVIHHEAHHVHYMVYSFPSTIAPFRLLTEAGITTDLSGEVVNRFRQAALSWAWSDTNGKFPIHYNKRPTMLSKTYSEGYNFGNAVWFLQLAAELTAAYEHGNGALIADDLEMAYPAIVKAGEGSGALPAAWRTITLPEPSGAEADWYLLQGHNSFQVMGAAMHRRDNWMASIRTGHKWRSAGETYDFCGTVVHHTKHSLQGALLLVTEGKNGRAPNEADSGIFYEGFDHNYWPNYTGPVKNLKQIILDKYYDQAAKVGDIVGGANLFDNGVWMALHNTGCKKSAFFFDNRMTLVTGAITGSDPDGYVTGLIQQGHPDFSGSPITVDGTTYSGTGQWTLSAGGNHKIIDVNGNGYYVHPHAATPVIKVSRAVQQWYYGLPEYWIGGGAMPQYITETPFLDDVNAGKFNPTTGNFSKLYFYHGTSCSNQFVATSILVKPAAGEFDAFVNQMRTAGQEPFTLDTSNADRHIFYDKATDTYAAALFSDSHTINKGGLVSVNRAGAYMWHNDGDGFRASCGSSDMGNTTPFVMVFSGDWRIEAEYDTRDAATVAYNSANDTTTVTLPYHQFARQAFVLAPANLPPSFNSDPVTKPDAYEGRDYTGQTLAADAADPEQLPLTFSKVSGPDWLTIAANGELSGIPADEHVGLNSFVIRVTDDREQFAQAALTITVMNTYSGQQGFSDFAGIASNWLTVGCGRCNGADVTGDGNVDTADLLHFAHLWLMAETF